MERVYLDHAATSPIHPSVVQAMLDVLEGPFGNPSSIHSYGREARKLVDDARLVIAGSIGAAHDEIIFTSGGTESDNSAIFSAVQTMKKRGKHIITTAIEHHAVLHTFQSLERQGYDVTYLPVDKMGFVSLESVKAALREDTILVSIMFGNNEVGSIQPIAEIGHIMQGHQAFFHTDAVQAYGVMPLSVKDLGVDFLSVSAHKINGPKGIGFLYIKKGISFMPLLFGGEQERKRRAGTENVASVAGFAKAVEIMVSTRDEHAEAYQQYRDILIASFQEAGIAFQLNGSNEHTLPHILNVSFSGTDVESMLVNLDLAGVAVSSGSACTAGSIQPSHVLVAMFGEDSPRTKNAIRFSFGLSNNIEQVKKAADQTVKIVNKLVRL